MKTIILALMLLASQTFAEITQASLAATFTTDTAGRGGLTVSAGAPLAPLDAFLNRASDESYIGLSPNAVLYVQPSLYPVTSATVVMKMENNAFMLSVYALPTSTTFKLNVNFLANSTNTPTFTPTNTVTPSATRTITPTPSRTVTRSATPTPSVTPSVSATLTVTNVLTITKTSTVTRTATRTQTRTATRTQTPTVTVTVTP